MKKPVHNVKLTVLIFTNHNSVLSMYIYIYKDYRFCNHIFTHPVTNIGTSDALYLNKLQWQH